MSELARLQELFWRGVRHEPAPFDPSLDFVGDVRLDATARLDIYRRAYWYRQIEALGAVFPKLREALGEERFTRMSTAYLVEHPSTHPALEWLGARLPGFLSRQGPFHAALSPLAQLEQARLESLLAPDSPHARLTDLAPEHFDQSRLELTTSLRLVHLPARSVRQHETGSLDPEGPEVPEATQATEPSPVAVVTWREGFSVQQRVLDLGQTDDRDELRALEAALREEPLGEVIQAFAETDAPEARASAVLAAWFQRGWVARVMIPGGDDR